MERFVKVWVFSLGNANSAQASPASQLGALFKNQLEIKRAIALQNRGSQTTRKEANLRAVGAGSVFILTYITYHRPYVLSFAIGLY
jgi:hypothetical protein